MENRQVEEQTQANGRASCGGVLVCSLGMLELIDPVLDGLDNLSYPELSLHLERGEPAVAVGLERTNLSGKNIFTNGVKLLRQG
jgi:hypothetical protein